MNERRILQMLFVLTFAFYAGFAFTMDSDTPEARIRSAGDPMPTLFGLAGFVCNIALVILLARRTVPKRSATK